MTFLTVDIAFRLTGRMRECALAVSELLVARMREAGRPSAFQLGHPFTPGGVSCQPHVSVFMLRLRSADVDRLRERTRSAVADLAPIEAAGASWGYNPLGAPELYLRHSPDWLRLQQVVVAAAEPLRAGLRDTDPAGDRLDDVVTRLLRDEPQSPRLRQLARYGYDEVTDDEDDRFRPHVTFAWPQAEPAPEPEPAARQPHVSLAGLPEPASCHGVLAELALYRMGSHGTCLEDLGAVHLGADPVRSAGLRD